MAIDRSELPPMMQRYLKYKDEYPDNLLFFQVGDFYELFFDDAVTVSRALNLTLTARDKAADSPIPMCGVPVSVIDSYVDRLVTIGHSSAIVSQVSSTVNGKLVIDRELNRIVTPGNRLFSNLDSDSGASFVAAVGFDADGRHAALAWIDPRDGVVEVKENIDRTDIARELGMIAPREIILPRKIGGEVLDRRQGLVRGIEQICDAPVKFRSEAEDFGGRDYSTFSKFAALGPVGKRTTRLLVSYIDETTVGCTLQLRNIIPYSAQEEMVIDASTRRNLELVTNARDGSERGTLLDYLNVTVTPAGKRLLRSRILAPMTNREAIESRLDVVELFKECSAERDSIRLHLTSVPDLERLAARIELGIVTPRDLGALRDALEGLPNLRESVASIAGRRNVAILQAALSDLQLSDELPQLLIRALVDNPPHIVNEGGIIKEGYSPELDHFRELRSNGDRWMSEFELSEKQRSGINSLKVKRNNVIGYFIEIPSSQSAKTPDDYIRRQSTSNAERFTTSELRSREQEVFGAIDKQVALERSLFDDLKLKVAANAQDLRRISGALTEIDIFSSFAFLAEREDLIRPCIEDNGRLDIQDGHHPMISRRLAGGFVPNSLSLETEGDRCCIITGPNMGGKSTYLRQAALLAVMAQIGSYIPARGATIGLIDRIFARIGASDDIHEGDSTFMVEMREASYIIGNATERSLVLIDEIGRGTATSDGLALAQAILEWLVATTRCRTLFATHFHELTLLARQGTGMRNLSVGSEESDDGGVVFTHFIKEGPAPRSYGIEVAKLSGLPDDLISRAEDLIETVSLQESNKQLSIFAPRNATKPKVEARLEKILGAINPDDLTPRAALDLVYSLRDEVRDGRRQLDKPTKTGIGNV